MQKIDWYKAARCAMRNKKKSLAEIAAAMADEQPDVAAPTNVKTHQWWAGIDTNGIATLEADTGWGGLGSFDATMPAIFMTKQEADERYQYVRPVTVTFEK